MKSLTGVFTALGLIRTVRPHGYCPACKGWVLDTDDPSHSTHHQVNPAALTILVVLVAAAFAWILTIVQLRSNAAMNAGMGLGSLKSFALTWLVMMAAMMLPSALPLVYEFARNSAGRRGWLVATAALSVTYLSIWLMVGVLFFTVYRIVKMPGPNQPLIGGLALVLAAFYAITPLKQASEARCRELCALHGPLPFNLKRSALLVGTRYGLSCVGCTAGLMVAAVIIGMTNLVWMVIISILILVYKLAPPLVGKYRLLASLAIAALGIVYIIIA